MTDGALIFSARYSGMRVISSSQSQRSPVRYSQPRPTGGAMLSIVSKEPAAGSTAVAVSVGSSRIRCWVVVVPAVSA